MVAVVLDSALLATGARRDGVEAGRRGRTLQLDSSHLAQLPLATARSSLGITE